MKKPKLTYLLTAVAAAALLCASCSRQNQGGSDEPQGDEYEVLTPKNFAAKMGLGWNLGNSFDAWSGGKSGETVWGNPRATQATFNAIKAMGFSSVRIPITWMGHIGAAPSYTIEKGWMDRVAEVVGYAHKAGLNVIINVHHDGSTSKEGTVVNDQWLSIRKASQSETDRAEITARYKALWSQIAERFKNEDDWLIFETLNEIHDGDWGNGANLHDNGKQYGILDSWNQTALDAIRATGAKNAGRIVAVAGYAASPVRTARDMKLPTDSAKGRLVVAVHSYDPWDFAGSGERSSWGKDVKPDGSDEKSYQTMIEVLNAVFLSKNIPVYMGECGCVHRSDATAENFRKYYIEYTVNTMRRYSIPPIVWDNGNAASGDDAFGLINHGNGSYINNAQEIVSLMVNTWNQ